MVPFEGTIEHRRMSSQINLEGTEQVARGSGHNEAGGQTVCASLREKGMKLAQRCSLKAKIGNPRLGLS